MKISYIVTVYNLEQYMVECMESVILNCTTGDCEVIIVDDGSTDGTGKISDEFAQRYPYIHVIHQENGGLAHARNVGTQAAAGEWLCFIDGDDYLLPGLVETAKPHLDADALDILFFDRVDDTEDARFKKMAPATGKLFQRCALYRSPVFKADPAYVNVHITTQWAKFYRKRFLLEHDLWSKEDVVLAQDIIFNLNVYACDPRMAYINKRFYYHRILLDSCCHRYRPNYGKISNIFIKRMNETIAHRYDNAPEMVEISYCTVINLINNYLVLNACNSQNPNPRQQREQAFWELLEAQEYREAVESCNGDLLTVEQRSLLKDVRSKDFSGIEKKVTKAMRKRELVAKLSVKAGWLLKILVCGKRWLRCILKF